MFGVEIVRVPVSRFYQAFLNRGKLIFLDERARDVKEQNRQSKIVPYYSSRIETVSKYQTPSFGKLVFNTDGEEWSIIVLPYSFDTAEELFDNIQ